MTRFILMFSILLVLAGAQESAVQKGIRLFNQGKLHDAKVILEKEYKAGNDELPLIKALYNIYFAGEQYKKAKEVFDREKKKLFEDNTAIQDYAIIHLELGEPDDAIALLKKSQKDQRYYEIMLEINFRAKAWDALAADLIDNKSKVRERVYNRYFGQLLDHYSALFEQHLKAKKTEEAIEACKAYIRLDPDPLYQFNLANLYYSGGEFTPSMEALTSIRMDRVKEQPLKFKILKLTGMILSKQNQPGKSINELKKAAAIKSFDFDLNYYFAHNYNRMKQYGTALEYASKALKSKKKDEEAKAIYNLYATIYISQKNYIQAEKNLAAYVKLAPKDKKKAQLHRKIKSYVIFDEANAAFDQKDYPTAAAKFDQAVKLYPPPVKPVIEIMHAKAIYMQSTTAEGEAKDKLITQAEKIAKSYMDDESILIDTYELLYNIYTDKQEFDKAKDIAEKQKEKLGTADDKFFHELGYNYELQKKFKQALEYYDKAYNAKKTENYKAKVVLMLKNLSTTLMNEGRYEEAETYVTRAVETARNVPGILDLQTRLNGLQQKNYLNNLVKKAEGLYKQKNYKAATPVYMEIYKIQPAYPKVIRTIAKCHLEMQDYSKAIYYYELDADKNKFFNSALGHLHCLSKLKRNEAIPGVVDGYLETFDARDQKALLEQRRINALINTGDLDGATTKLTELLSTDAANSTFNILLGNCHFGKGDYYKAEKAYLKSIKSTGKATGVVSYNLGVVKYKKGEYQAALTHLKKADSLTTDKTAKAARMELISFYTALVYYKLGRSLEAEPFIKRTLTYNKKAGNKAEEDNIRNIWWYSEIHAKNKKNLADPKLKAKIMGFLDKCIDNKIDREIAFFASNLKVLLTPGARVTLDYEVTDIGKSDPLFAGEFFIYQDANNTVKAISEQTSKIEWEIDEKAPYSCSPQYEKHLILALESEFIKAIDINTGGEVYRINDYARDFLLVENDIIYVNKELIRTSEGKEKYRINPGFASAHSISASGNQMLIAGNKNAAICNMESGEVTKKITFSNADASYLSGNWLYTMETNNKKSHLVTFYSAQSGVKVSSFKYKGAWQAGQYILVHKDIYIYVYNNGNIIAKNIKTQKNAWKHDLKNTVTDSSLAEGSVIVSLANGMSYKINAANGNVAWKNSFKLQKDQIVTLLIGK